MLVKIEVVFLLLLNLITVIFIDVGKTFNLGQNGLNL